VLARGTARETRIAKGTTVLAAIQSAMADPAWVEEPEAFKTDRPDHVYLHLGYGHHECLGRYVAQTMIPEMVRQLLLRPGLRALAPPDKGGGPFPVRYEIAYG
jgi:cytochrome P450